VKQLRQKKAKPILDEFGKWLEEQVLKTPPSGLLGKTISYALGQWNRLPTAKTKKDQKALLPQYADRTKIGSPS